MNDKGMAVSRQNTRKRTSRFQQLWLQVEAMVEEKAQLEAALDRLAMRLASEVLPAEEALASVCRQALERLLWFSERKTLGKKLRMALTPWMDELLDRLVDIADVDEDLRRRLARHHAAVLNVPLDANSGESEWCQLEAWLEQQQRQNGGDEWEWLDATRTCAELHEMLDEAVDDEPLPQYGQGPLPGAQGQADAEGGRSEHTGLHDATFKRLFRQTAAALHPDKETDEQKRRDKHVLMTRLLQARRDHDLITLLHLHRHHAGRQDVLNDADERQLEGALMQHLAVLGKQRAALAAKSFLHFQAYHRFHDEDAAVVDARIIEYIDLVQKRQRVYRKFLDDVGTLKQLRERLQPRLHPGQPWLNRLW